MIWDGGSTYVYILFHLHEKTIERESSRDTFSASKRGSGNRRRWSLPVPVPVPGRRPCTGGRSNARQQHAAAAATAKHSENRAMARLGRRRRTRGVDLQTCGLAWIRTHALMYIVAMAESVGPTDWFWYRIGLERDFWQASESYQKFFL